VVTDIEIGVGERSGTTGVDQQRFSVWGDDEDGIALSDIDGSDLERTWPEDGSRGGENDPKTCEGECRGSRPGGKAATANQEHRQTEYREKGECCRELRSGKSRVGPAKMSEDVDGAGHPVQSQGCEQRGNLGERE